MPAVDLVVSVEGSNSIRARQVSCMFDCPLREKLERRWAVDLPIEQRDWDIGLICGPSGSGKSTVGLNLFGKEKLEYQSRWGENSVIDDFSEALSVQEISEACSAVGFNTIPSWLKPYRVLSNGEKFRIDLARRILEQESPIVMDEFTSVVDRQVAKVACHAAQKYIRRGNKKFVAITCHEDVVDWLQPDWVFRPDSLEFEWRLLRRRPSIEGSIRRVDKSMWTRFSAYHYMSATLHPAAKCYAIFVHGAPVAFAGVLPRPISRGVHRGECTYGVSRLVTHPDWQGLGLAFVLVNNLGAAFDAAGKKLSTYPAHPALIRSFHKSSEWKCRVQAGGMKARSKQEGKKSMGGRFNAVFDYVGPLARLDSISWLGPGKVLRDLT